MSRERKREKGDRGRKETGDGPLSPFIKKETKDRPLSPSVPCLLPYAFTVLRILSTSAEYGLRSQECPESQ